MARILVTGAAGFIGRALCRGLLDRGHAVLGQIRRPVEAIPGVQLRPIGSIGPETDWSRHLDRVDIVVHLANRAAWDTAAESEPEAAAVLMHAAAEAGVRRLLHFSSIRAMGASTPPGVPFRGTDPPLPRDPYGVNKLDTELRLQEAAQQTGVELVILRPPLVYGPGVKGNFRALLRLAGSGLPLPFAEIDNRRSMIFLDNLVDLAALACVHADAAGRVLLARDAADWSTPALIKLLAAGLHRPTRLFAIPRSAFAALRGFPGLGPLIARLTVSLQIDDRETRAALDWRPPVRSEIGLAATARAFRERS